VRRAKGQAKGRQGSGQGRPPRDEAAVVSSARPVALSASFVGSFPDPLPQQVNAPRVASQGGAAPMRALETKCRGLILCYTDVSNEAARYNYLPFSDMDHREGGQGLRDLLRLFVADDDTDRQREVEALLGVKTRPVNEMLPGNGPLVFGRGIECVLTIDETGFSGGSPYLLGLILEHYLARHVSMNSFTQTELHSMQRGLVARWPVRMGTRGVA